VVPATSWSGPNEGGVVIVHSPADIVYTDDVDYCGQSGIIRCFEADVRVEGTDIATFFILAAFPEANSPRLAGVTLGIGYSTDDIELVDWGTCGDFQLPTNDWPEPGSGSAVTWLEAQTDHVVEIHWFAAYNASGNPATFDVTEHPSRGGSVIFADDSIPAEIDIAVDHGRLGFGGEEGYLPCPDPVPVEQTTWGQLKATYRALE
jgi:hypothetical protein